MVHPTHSTSFTPPTSAQPTLNPDSSLWRDIVIFDRWSIRTRHQYRRGDVVSLRCSILRVLQPHFSYRVTTISTNRSPSDSKLIVKRIIALEGDVVSRLEHSTFRMAEFTHTVYWSRLKRCHHIPTRRSGYLKDMRGSKVCSLHLEGVMCPRSTTFVLFPLGDEPFKSEDSNYFGPVCGFRL